MTHLSTAKLAELAKVQKRQIQRILDSGFPDLGATRSAGGHWLIPDTAKVREWAMNHERWNRGVIPKEIEKILSSEGLMIPAATKKKDWITIHKAILLVKKIGINLRKKWIKQSRDFAIGKFGIDFVAETEIKMEMQSGVHFDHAENSVNPRDKSKAIVTIEGINGMFKLWHRKVMDDMEGWDERKVDMAIELLKPMALVYAQLLASKKGFSGE